MIPTPTPKLYTIEQGTVRLNLHPGQTRVWDSAARVTAMIAGTQSGKTTFGPWWLYREICGGWNYTGRGAGDYIAATASYDLFKLKMLPALRTVFEHVTDRARYWSGDKVLELRDPETGQFWANRADDPMWGRIILRSASAEGGLESATAQAAWLDEAGHPDFPMTAMEAVWRRLSLSRGRILITTTPYNMGWLKQQIYDPWKAGDPDYHVVQFASTVNPEFQQVEMQSARARLPYWKFSLFYLGQFERPEGLIYSAFQDKHRDYGGHRVTPFELPAEWPRYVGIDPGAVHMASLWLAHDYEHDIYYAYRSTLMGGMATHEHAGRLRQYGENVIVWIVGAKSEEQQRMDWQAAGIPAIEPPYHDVESGIDHVIALLKQHRLLFFEDDGENGMNGLFDELATYSRKLDADGLPTEDIKDKQKYHQLDALRYGVAGTTMVFEDAGEITHGGQFAFSTSNY